MKKVEKTKQRFLKGLKKLLSDNDAWIVSCDNRMIICIPHFKFMLGNSIIDKNNIDEAIEKQGWTLDDELRNMYGR